MTSRILRSGLVPGIALLLAATACTPESGPSGDPGGEGTDSGPDYTAMTAWGDEACDVLDPDAVTDQLHIGAYTEGPVSQDPYEGDYPGSVKCISFYDYPADLEIPENSSKTELSGWLYQVITPFGSTEEATTSYQALFDSKAAMLRGRDEEEQIVDTTIEGDWDQGAILASVGSSGTIIAMYQSAQYLVYIEIGGDTDPGVENELALIDGDTFRDPTYEYTPTEITDWMTSDYLPAVQEAITAKLEG